jgi:hypothetical protein
LRLVNQNEAALLNKIENTKTLIADLPETNWFNHNQALINDHKNLGDSGLVDLLLHGQDTSYNIEQVYQLLDTTHLNFIEFTNVKMRLAYQPSTYISDPVLLKKLADYRLKSSITLQNFKRVHLKNTNFMSVMCRMLKPVFMT